MNAIDVFERIRQDALSILPEEELLERLQSGRRLKIKLGADPSRPDLHLGHSVVLRKLRLLQELGHEIIFVIGDFTGMIGDPSGRNKTRPPLTFEETRTNAQSYFEQVTKILDPQKTRITYNSEWLAPMDFRQVLQLAGKYTAARVLERDDFAERMAKNHPIGMHELFYPLMQGYDSVALRADIEVGGSDQTFNLLVGRDLQRAYGQQAQVVITFPLLPGLDGVEKMSKSLDNYIGIDEAPDVMFEKCMKVPDSLLRDYFRLTTDLPREEYQPLLDGDIRAAHFAYAHHIVALYWDEQAARLARQRYCEVARGGLPETVPERTLPFPVSLLDALVLCGFAASRSQARRLVLGRGVRLNGMLAADPLLELYGEGPLLLQKGKNKFMRLLPAASES